VDGCESERNLVDRADRARPQHCRVDGLRLSALAIQQPRIPIWIGGDWLVPPLATSTASPGLRRRKLGDVGKW
jgi:hypothetical protein